MFIYMLNISAVNFGELCLSQALSRLVDENIENI